MQIARRSDRRRKIQGRSVQAKTMLKVSAVTMKVSVTTTAKISTMMTTGSFGKITTGWRSRWLLVLLVSSTLLLFVIPSSNAFHSKNNNNNNNVKVNKISSFSTAVTPPPSSLLLSSLTPPRNPHESQPFSVTTLSTRSYMTTTPTSTTTSLFASSGNDNDNDTTETKPKNYYKETGLYEGYYLLGFVMIVAIWLFSIPVEYRRANICSEEQTRSYPDSNCMTVQTWTSGIAQYYKNGGGIQFDFSIDPNSKML